MATAHPDRNIYLDHYLLRATSFVFIGMASLPAQAKQTERRQLLTWIHLTALPSGYTVIFTVRPNAAFGTQKAAVKRLDLFMPTHPIMGG
jgi:hypothetical protein